MPCTFAHPVAVLPFRRFCPAVLHFPALVMGSMAPDMGYYLHAFQFATFAHTWAGTLAVGTPSGLLMLAGVYLLRRPVCYLLPQPHRGALMSLATRPVLLSGWSFASMAVSVLIGVWTHTIWDAFTHAGGWAVERAVWLREPVVEVCGTRFTVAYVLQQASTVGGGVALGAAYLTWLRKNRVRAGALTARTQADGSERIRYAILAGLAIVSLAVAVPLASGMAARFEGYLAWRVLVFRTAVYAVAVFVPLFVASAGMFYLRRPGR